MIKEAILIAGGVAIHGAGKVVKKTGEKIDEMQKERFNKVVEQNKKAEIEHEQIWMEEELVKKRKLLEEKVYHQYDFYNLDNELVYCTRGGIIKGRRKVEIHTGAHEKLAFIEETGATFAEEKDHPEYSIFVGGARVDVARLTYEGKEAYLELDHKKWRLYFDKNGVQKIVDAEGVLMLEVEKQIAKRRMISIYTEDRRMCILLFLAGIVHRL
ncbi:MAG: hypothetical protein IKO10_14965 [Lachnospiraceae bacterium]|nr:hypothetical protein [Lachnospiraceae bacterium]